MKRRIIGGSLGAVVITWLGLCAWSLASARSASASAVSGLAAIVEDDDLGLDDLTDGTLSDRLTPVEAGFGRATEHLDRLWLGPARHLPVLGRQLRTATALTELGADLTARSAEVLAATRALLERVDGDPARTVDEVAARLDDLDAVLAAPDLGPDRALFAALADARAEAEAVVARARPRLAELAAVVDLASTLLDDRSHWLLLVANNAEMRVGSGMILQAGELHIDAGVLSVEDLRPSYERNIDRGVAVIDPDVDRNWAHMLPSAEWRQLGLTTRFDATASSAAAMYEVFSGRALDGVVLIDPFALEAVLELAGLAPSDVGIGSGSVTEHLLVDQYDGLTQADQDARRDELGRTARRVLGSLDLERIDTTSLLDLVGDLAASRHLLAWSSDPGRGRAIEAVGADGGAGPDSLSVAVANFGATKLDPYLEIAATWRTDRDGPTRTARLVVEVTNAAPHGLPAHVSGFGDLGRYVGSIVVTLPAAVEDPVWIAPRGATARLSGADGDGTITVLDIELDRGDDLRAVVEMTLPDSLTRVEVLADARPTPIVWRIGGQNRTGTTDFVAFLAR